MFKNFYLRSGIRKGKKLFAKFCRLGALLFSKENMSVRMVQSFRHPLELGGYMMEKTTLSVFGQSFVTSLNKKNVRKTFKLNADYLRKVIEERTKQLKDSERLVAIGQTAGMVGHDLRNPLQTIIGELFLAKNEVKSLSDGEVKNSLQESIRTIEDQAVYMDKIVSDLQAFVQPVKIDKKPINLKELVDGCFGFCRHSN